MLVKVLRMTDKLLKSENENTNVSLVLYNKYNSNITKERSLNTLYFQCFPKKMAH